RFKSHPTNGTAHTHASKPPSLLHGRATTNSGLQLAASTTSTGIGICSALVRQWKNSRPGSARISRAGFGVPPKQSFIVRGFHLQEMQDEKFATARTRSPAGETRALPFRRQLWGADAGGNEAKRAAVRFLGCSGTGFVIFSVAVHLPEVVKLC